MFVHWEIYLTAINRWGNRVGYNIGTFGRFRKTSYPVECLSFYIYNGIVIYVQRAEIGLSSIIEELYKEFVISYMPYTAEKAIVRYGRDIKEIAIIKGCSSCLDTQSSCGLSGSLICFSWCFGRCWILSNSS